MLKKKFIKSKDQTEVTFEFSRADIESVSLVADFNDWQPLDMSFSRKDKVFRAKVKLPKDEVFYFRYLLNDSEWENDYQADAYIPNNFGTDNSVVYTQVAR
ncbi:isoamylase early set domain-containing protein [Oceanicoccus sp. KOV_DT_Chl]|uniref:isoamylase early set domain-containing protein n=1 Tax=Oceanicoccus sp. KOV_DT_Chl TaxID=1904639 RepID=UPI000C7DCAAD|nr:isoamylase early set domain-containing protein [Oceanicoccus sp. KOV_DT_Chl]